MVAGEFAVLEPHHHLAVMAVDRFVYADIRTSESNLLTLRDLGLERVSWEFEDGRIHIHTVDERIRFIEDAMRISCTYLSEQGISLHPFHLSIRSELDDESGIKYGLGSSAAVVSAATTAILKHFLGEKASEETIFKLAATAHVKTQGNGSGADIAASVFGGLLEYTSFQAEWLLDAYLHSGSLTELLEMEWVYYSSKPIQMPADIHFCVGWTGKPASTSKLVDRILTLKGSHPEHFSHFLQESHLAVGSFLEGMEKGDKNLLFEGIKRNRKALATVGEQASTSIETPMLSRLCDIAEELGGAGKPSGAGGGVCGIAFMPSRETAVRLMEEWEKAGIKPLAIQPWISGGELEHT